MEEMLFLLSFFYKAKMDLNGMTILFINSLSVEALIRKFDENNLLFWSNYENLTFTCLISNLDSCFLSWM